jgi:hypothetical protein
MATVAQILADLPAYAEAQAQSCAEDDNRGYQSTEEPQWVALGVGGQFQAEPARY